MYVQYLHPEDRQRAGDRHGATARATPGPTYETTPDGREGWATYFARKGFPVYVVDHAGRGALRLRPDAGQPRQGRGRTPPRCRNS